MTRMWARSATERPNQMSSFQKSLFTRPFASARVFAFASFSSDPARFTRSCASSNVAWRTVPWSRPLMASSLRYVSIASFSRPRKMSICENL